MHYTKRLFLLLIVSVFLFSSLTATPAANVYEYTLENGMQVFLLEDSTDALVHIEYTCHAGASSQTQNTCGFFSLFSRLIKTSTPQLYFSDIQCNADSTRYILNISPDEIEQTLSTLSNSVFESTFSEEQLQSELTKMKNEVSDNAETMSTYINAAIDSRVFSDAPWKNDSGIYPPLFKKTTAKTARTILKDIAERWYIPKNSAIFISGNINNEKILLTLKNTFGRFYSNYNTPVEKPSFPINQHRKYVFHSPDISPDLTQIVIQYTMLNIEQCDLLAATLNNNASTLKKTALEYEELNIPGAEYIDISAAHKRNSSRLIIQTLAQPPVNKKSGITSFNQAELFSEIITKLPETVLDQEFQFAKSQLIFDMNYMTANPVLLMDSLSSFWAGQYYYQAEEEDTIEYPESITTSLLMSRVNHLKKQELATTMQTFAAEEPFIFVIINSNDYKSHKKEYKNAGYEEINENNSSWYVQTMYKEIKEQFKPSEEQIYSTNSKNNSDNNYYDRNLSQIKNTELTNGIKIISKQNELSTGVSLLLSIQGGKIHSSKDNGFEEIMVNLFAGLIQKEIYKKQVEGMILGMPSVTSKTDLSSSYILIEFEKEDTIPVCEAISNSLIYGEIAPADADRAVSSRQYKKRLENGSAVNQMNSALINAIYGKGQFYSIFDSENDVLQTTDYKTILGAYPQLLDADRYSVILTGNFDDNIFPLLEKTMGLLSNNHTAINLADEKTNVPKNKSITVKVRHTFLTDIPAEKAGPQPAKLIPTKEFLDPVIYALKSPEAGTKEAALFNAVLNYLGTKLQTSIDASKKFNNSTVIIQLPRSKMDFGTITIQNVNHIKEADVYYKNEIQNLLSELQKIQSSKKVIQEIKNAWIIQQLSETYTNSGTAKLLQKGLELFPETPDSAFYLNEYNFIQTASVQDFLEIMDYFPTRAQVRVYSAEGKN